MLQFCRAQNQSLLCAKVSITNVNNISEAVDSRQEGPVGRNGWKIYFSPSSSLPFRGACLENSLVMRNDKVLQQTQTKAGRDRSFARSCDMAGVGGRWW